MQKRTKERIDQRWIAKDGSILTATVYERKADLGFKYKTQDGIAFNIGQELAEYIVRMHNEKVDNVS